MIAEKFNTQTELFDYLRANKKRLIAEKCFKKKNKIATQFNFVANKTTATKAIQEVREIQDGVYPVTIIGNTFNWCDDQMDVLFAGCATKTIKEVGVKGKNLIYHLKNHDTETESRIGYLTDIYEMQVSLTDLGLNMQGNATVLAFDSDVQEGLCDNSYKQYKDIQVRQHSIGLQYVKIFLCVNDPNDAEHFANWNKYYMNVINKDLVNSVGYFWVVTEIKLYEVSFVLWGSNELTGVIEEQKDSEPIIVTHQKTQSPSSTEETIKIIKSKNYFKI